MHRKILFFLLCFPSFLQAVDNWYVEGQQRLQQALRQTPNTRAAKNVIIFLGDGMSIATINAARIYEGQQHGKTGEENSLVFERFPYSGLVKTYNTDAMVPDSAGTMSAIMTGVKTDAGIISLRDSVRYGVCDGPQAHQVITALEWAESHGKSTGVVTTARLTHATPAATYAHSASREWESDSDMPSAQKQKSCTDIAMQFVQFDKGNGIDVAFGGGRENFLRDDQHDMEYVQKKGKRKDGNDLIAAWQAQHKNGRFVWNREQFLDLEKSENVPVLGLFEPSHMQYESERVQHGEREPSLTEMTRTALRLLQKSNAGFFLMVESGRIDHAHHGGNARNALNETVELSRAVQAALELTSEKDTLIIVTADHGHTLSLAGNDVRRGNPVLGLAEGLIDEENRALDHETEIQKDLNGKPIAVLNYINGPGFGRLGETPFVRGGRADLHNVDTQHWLHRQEALIPLKSETHSGEDVAVYAQGPWAHLFTGSIEQNTLFHFYMHAMQTK